MHTPIHTHTHTHTHAFIRTRLQQTYPHHTPPSDPVETLALYLIKSSTRRTKREKELAELKATKTRLRAELTSEFAVVGRV